MVTTHLFWCPLLICPTYHEYLPWCLLTVVIILLTDDLLVQGFKPNCEDDSLDISRRSYFNNRSY